MTVTPLLLFEELRFVVELLGGISLFLLPFARPKPHAARNAVNDQLVGDFTIEVSALGG